MLPPPTLDEQITLLDQIIVSYRRSLAGLESELEIRMPESTVSRDLECLEATRRILVWAKYHAAFVTMGNHLTAAQRAELKELEAACIQSVAPGEAAVQALHAREKEYEVFDEKAFSPRWQD
jgi:hypothetical protein